MGEFQAVTFTVLLLVYLYLYTIFSMLAISASAILLIKLKQLSTVLYFPYQRSKKFHHSTNSCVRYFIKHYTSTMGYIFKANPFYGKALLIFIAANWPCNLVILVNFFNQNISFANSLFFGGIILQQSFCLFGNHYLATMFCRTIHQPSKRLLKLDVLIKSLKTRDHIKLSHYTQMLHTNNQYGVTYGSLLGLITVNKFFKVSQKKQSVPLFF